MDLTDTSTWAKRKVRHIRYSTNDSRQWNKRQPITNSELEPASDRLGDRQAGQVVGDVLGDQAGDDLHGDDKTRQPLGTTRWARAGEGRTARRGAAAVDLDSTRTWLGRVRTTTLSRAGTR